MTGLRIVSSALSALQGLGTGVATALGINVGSAGAIVTNGGVLGTPASGTGTNLTGIPVGALTGLGTGVGTALAANTSATGGFPLQTGPASWTPADASGAGLTFSSVSVNYTRMGPLVFVYGQLTFPATASTAAITISGLPVTSANTGYAVMFTTCYTSKSLSFTPYVFVNQNSTTFNLYNETTGVAVQNIALTAGTIFFSFVYPAV